MTDYALSEMPNGIRLIHKQMNHTKVAHIGLMLDIGSRDELATEQGIAHFWEHMAFKGTTTRSANYIINRLENLGGELNAYTTKEKICFYATILDDHVDKAIELLIDIAFRATFPEKQLELERSVILEEMAMYRDTPEDSIQDELEELVYKAHPIGANILGTEDTVGRFQPADFKQFLGRNLNTTRVVISSVGSYSMSKIEKLTKKYLADIPYKNHTAPRLPVNGYTPEIKNIEKPITQAHLAIGKRAFDLYDERRVPFFMLTNILGGPAMNSRFNMSLREKNGLVYHVDAHFSSYTDTGMFSVFLGTDKKNLKKAKSLLLKEIEQLQKSPLSDRQLHIIKQQLKGQLALSEENNNGMMLMMAKSMIDLNRVPSLQTVFQKIDETTASQLQSLAIEQLNPADFTWLTYLPSETPAANR